MRGEEEWREWLAVVIDVLNQLPIWLVILGLLIIVGMFSTIMNSIGRDQSTSNRMETHAIPQSTSPRDVSAELAERGHTQYSTPVRRTEPIRDSRAEEYVNKVLATAKDIYSIVPFGCRQAYQTRPDRPEQDTWQGGCVGHYKSGEASAYASIVVWAEMYEGKLHPIIDFHSFVYSGEIGIMQHCSISSIEDDFLDNCTQEYLPTQTGLMIVDSEGVSVGLVEPEFDILEQLRRE